MGPNTKYRAGCAQPGPGERTMGDMKNAIMEKDKASARVCCLSVVIEDWVSLRVHRCTHWALYSPLTSDA